MNVYLITYSQPTASKRGYCAWKIIRKDLEIKMLFPHLVLLRIIRAHSKLGDILKMSFE